MARKNVTDLAIKGYAPSLFDVEDANAAAMKVRDMVVGPVAPSEVKEFTHRYHYTGHGGADTWRWGLWHGAVLIGVVSYNTGSPPLGASVLGKEHGIHVWHMGRLALAEDAPRNSESRLIAGSLQAIKEHHPECWAVVTFAAQNQGHIGYVYQATNALYTGTGGRHQYFVDASGRQITDRQDGTVLRRDQGEEKGWVHHSALPKHRYIYLLGSKTQRRQRRRLLRHPVLPYPKEV